MSDAASTLQSVWIELCAVRRNKRLRPRPDALDTLLGREYELEKQLGEIYNACTEIPAREKALISAATDLACCCTNGAGDAEAYCKVTYGDTK